MKSRSRIKSERAARHVRLYHWLLSTAAWQSLPPNARAAYVEIARRYTGTNNGRIHFSVREAADALRIGKHAAAIALVQLKGRGFIVVTKRGGFNLRYKDQMATEWRLTEFNSDIDSGLATKDFTRWESPEKNFTVPVAGQSVPVGGQDRTCGGTVVALKSRMGT